MLLKVKYGNAKKYIKLQADFGPADFFQEVRKRFGLSVWSELQIFDESDTEVEEDILVELIEANPDQCLIVCDRPLEQKFSPVDQLTPCPIIDTTTPSCPSDNVFTKELGRPIAMEEPDRDATKSSTADTSESEAAREMVENILHTKPGGEDVLKEFSCENSLKLRTRRQLVNILASHMAETHGKNLSRLQKEKYALGIITLFPSLKDPFSPKGYEHFYNGEKSTGYLAWRLKTMFRKKHSTPLRASSTSKTSELHRKRPAVEELQQFHRDPCKEAFLFIPHCNEESDVFEKMGMSFAQRQKLVHDLDRRADVLTVFPRFLDVKGLVNQDFVLLFGPETASRLLEKWETILKHKIPKEAKQLTQTNEVQRLLRAAEDPAGGDESDWDSDIASLLLLLHLLPPTAGRNRIKISPTDAGSKMVHFQKLLCRIDDLLHTPEHIHPYLLAVGPSKSRIETFYIVVYKQLIPCQAASSLAAFDELFKCHHIFNLPYDQSLIQFYTFLQTSVYKIYTTTTEESPRVREFRAKLFNSV